MSSRPSVLRNTLKTFALYSGSIAVGGISLFLFDKHIGGIRTVDGPSMRPTFNKELYNVSNAANRGSFFDGKDSIVFSRSTQHLARGDIVLIQSPRTRNHIIKRVVGLEGDSVKPLGVNNVARSTPVTIPPDHIWVESDAGFGYEDSSSFGPVEKGFVFGKVKYCNWTTSKFEFWSYKNVDNCLGPSVLNRVTVSQPVD